MTYRETKTTLLARPGVPSDEKLPASEYNNLVAYLIDHATEHEAGGEQALDLGALAGQVSTDQIEDLAITTAKLAVDSVTNAKLADDSVDTAEIVTNAVTVAELADALGTDANNKIPGETFFVDSNHESIRNQHYNEPTPEQLTTTSPVTIDLSLSGYHDPIELTEDTTVELTGSLPDGNSALIYFVDGDDGGPYDVTFDTTNSTIKRPGGSATFTVAQSSNHEVTVRTPDAGSVYRVTTSGQDFEDVTA